METHKDSLPKNVVSVTEFRSKPLVNMDNDMVRVVIDMPKLEWRSKWRKIFQGDENYGEKQKGA